MLDKKRYLNLALTIVAVIFAVFSNSILLHRSSDFKSGQIGDPAIILPGEIRNAATDGKGFFKNVSIENIVPFTVCWFFVGFGAFLISFLKFTNNNRLLMEQGESLREYNRWEGASIFIVSFLGTMVTYPASQGQELGFPLIYGSIMSGLGWASLLKEMLAKT